MGYTPTRRNSDVVLAEDLTKVADSLERQDGGHEVLAAVTTTTSTQRRSTAYLDGLRGLASLMVYMSHHVPWFYGFDTSTTSLERAYGDGARDFAMLPFVRILFTGGSAAVAIFFVLSGYVLSKGPLDMLREHQTRKCYTGLISATIRRPLRLFLPALGVSLVMALIMQLPFGMAPHMTWPEPKENLLAQLANLADEFRRVIDPFDAHGIATRWFPYNPPMWTIAIEFRGSIITFALLAAYSRVSTWVRFLLFCVTGFIFLMAYEWSIACFMAGIALAINDQEGYDISFLKRYSSRTRTFVHVSVLMIGWWLMCQPAGKREPERAQKAFGWYYVTMLAPGVYYRQEYWRFWHSWGAVLTLYGVLRLHLVQRFFNTKHMQYLGKVSFCLYLTHIPFLWTFADRIYRVFGTQTMDFKTEFDNVFRIPDVGPRGLSLRFLISQAFILSLNLLLAGFATRWLDEPSVRAGRWLSAKIISQKSGTSRAPSDFKEMRSSAYR